MDFDSALESYDKALELSLADSTRKKVETALMELTKKKLSIKISGNSYGMIFV